MTLPDSVPAVPEVPVPEVPGGLRENSALLLDAARLCRMAYCDPDTVARLYDQHPKDGDPETLEVLKRVTQAPGFLNDPTSDAQGYAIHHQDALVLAFRGTSSMTDALTDMNARLVPLRLHVAASPAGVLVHAGFLNQFLQLRKQVLDFLEGCKDDPKPILVCGHSLGSATAAICALVLALQMPSRISYVGYGTPRVGNKAWVDAFQGAIPEGCTLRVKAGRDPVDSCLPPPVYQHLPPKMHVGRADPYPDICLLPDLPDHDMAYYIECLKKDSTSERPTAWLPYFFGFAWELPYKLYKIVATSRFYSPF